MAFFNVREWIDRISEHPNRRTLTNVNDPTDVKTYDLSRAEGTVTTQGTAITGANLTDLERRIGSAFTAVQNALPEANPAEEATGSLTKLKVGGTVYDVEGGGGTTIEKITKAEWDAMTAEEREAFIGVVEDTNGVYLPLTAENIPFDSNNSIAEKVNKLTVKLTLAEYNALTEKAPNTRYILTDAPALEYTAEDLSYDGGTETTKQKIEANTQALTPQTITITPNTSVASNFVYNVFKVGKIVIYAISCKLTASVSRNGTIIASGLPKAANSTQIPVTSLPTGQTHIMAITTDGNLQTRDTNVQIYTIDAYIMASGSYITSE